MSKPKIVFGCPLCGYRPEIDRAMSNENWNVYKAGNCPKCGSRMQVVFEDKDTGLKEAYAWKLKSQSDCLPAKR